MSVQYKQLGELPQRSSGASWTDEEDEKLRGLYLHLCKEMTGRSPAAVFARISILRERRYYQWPETGEAE
jgi:hypothetical protein